MKSVRRVILSLSLSVLLMCSAALAGTKIDSDDLPAPVKSAITQRYFGAKILSAERDKAAKSSTTVYRVKIRHQGIKYALEFSANGAMTGRKRDD